MLSKPDSETVEKKSIVREPSEHGPVLHEIVRFYESVYRSKFMHQSLNFLDNAKPGEWVRLSAMDWPENGRYCWINLNYWDGEAFPSCAVAETEIVFSKYGTSEAFIYYGSTLARASKSEQKYYLAHEWLEAMRRFIHEEPLDSFLPNLAPVELFDRLRKAAPWQDSPSYQKYIDEAVKALLLPESVVLEHARNLPGYDYTPGKTPEVYYLADFVSVGSDISRFETLRQNISRHEHVDADIVSDRLFELLQFT